MGITGVGFSGSDFRVCVVFSEAPLLVIFTGTPVSPQLRQLVVSVNKLCAISCLRKLVAEMSFRNPSPNCIIYLPIYLSVCLSIHPFSLSLSPSLPYLSNSICICQFIFLSYYLSVMSVYLSTSLSVCLSIHSSLSLSPPPSSPQLYLSVYLR